MEDFKSLIERKKKGSLKIYLGYAPGVGKTYAMLQEGLRLCEYGLDVVVGYVEPHTRPDTIKLLIGQECVEPIKISRGGGIFQEMNLDSILQRAPQVVLVDELPHNNIKGVKNKKRYEDVLEILDNGINVITNMNVQHVESMGDKVENALLVTVQERVPDSILKLANQVVNIDLSIEDLRERLRIGKVYEPERVEVALVRFFTYENLSLLRKFALQETANYQLRKIEEERLFGEQGTKEADEVVMYAISSSTANADALIRKSTRMASQLSSRCYVVYVQQKHESAEEIDSEVQRKLLERFKLAKMLGAEVVILHSDKVSEALVNFAQTHNVRHIVFGKTTRSPLQERLFGAMYFDFIYDSVGIDIHIMSSAPGKRERVE